MRDEIGLGRWVLALLRVLKRGYFMKALFHEGVISRMEEPGPGSKYHFKQSTLIRHRHSANGEQRIAFVLIGYIFFPKNRITFPTPE